MKNTFPKIFLPGCLILCILVSTTCKKLEKTMVVTTGEVTSFTNNSADVPGQIVDLGDGANQHGHCYGISPNLTISGTKTLLGPPAGVGGFTSHLTGLQSGTLYYVKAYLSNGTETVYGKELSFTTLTGAGVSISTTEISAVTATTAVSGGNISSDGGTTIIARGVCWGTSTGPTITGSKTQDGSGNGIFVSNITGLTASTKYYVRAYATNNGGTAYGNEESFITSSVIINAPTELSATEGSDTWIRLGWLDNSDNEDGFRIERSPDGSTNWSEIFATGPNVSSFQNEGLAASTTYYYRVRAYNAGGNSDYSNMDMATTQASAKANLHITNNSHYDMIDITLNGNQYITDVGTGLIVGNSFEDEFPSSGNISYNLGVGFWDGTSRNVWFFISGEVNVTVGSVTYLTFNNPTIGELLSYFTPSLDWAGIYYDSFSNPYIASYNFTNAGNWTFYDDFVAKATGTVTLVSWPDYATTITFMTCPTCDPIQLVYPFESFFYENGPVSWPVIEYFAQYGKKGTAKGPGFPMELTR